MPCSIPTLDEVLVAGALANVPVTRAQAQAVIDTIKRIESPDSDCIGLKSWHIAGVENAIAYRPLLAGDDAFIELHLHYLPREVETTELGLEVALIGPDGRVRDSQDFG